MSLLWLYNYTVFPSETMSNIYSVGSLTCVISVLYQSFLKIWSIKMSKMCVPWVYLDKEFCMTAMPDTVSVNEEYSPISHGVWRQSLSPTVNASHFNKP